MKQFVQRAGGRIGLWGGLLAAALAAFAAGWLVPARAPVGCNLNELTAAPDFSPFSSAAPVVASVPLGVSTAITVAPLSLMAANTVSKGDRGAP